MLEGGANEGVPDRGAVHFGLGHSGFVEMTAEGEGRGVAALGILSLETRFPRIPGDVGNPQTWPFPTLIRRVTGATPARVVGGRAEGLLQAFAEAARELVQDGAAGIATTCGFLVLHQAELQRRVPVPVATSALLQLPLVARCLPPGLRPGIVTISAASLSGDHLAAAGADRDTPIAGVAPEGECARVFLGDAETLDREAAEREVVAAARDLVTRHPDVGSIVLECTNMGPYAGEVRRALGLPVYDIVTFLRWFQAGLQPREGVVAERARAAATMASQVA